MSVHYVECADAAMILSGFGCRRAIEFVGKKVRGEATPGEGMTSKASEVTCEDCTANVVKMLPGDREASRRTGSEHDDDCSDANGWWFI